MSGSKAVLRLFWLTQLKRRKWQRLSKKKVSRELFSAFQCRLYHAIQSKSNIRFKRIMQPKVWTQHPVRLHLETHFNSMVLIRNSSQTLWGRYKTLLQWSAKVNLLVNLSWILIRKKMGTAITESFKQRTNKGSILPRRVHRVARSWRNHLKKELHTKNHFYQNKLLRLKMSPRCEISPTQEHRKSVKS